MPTPLSLSSEDFDAAKAVFEQLKDLPPERQARVLRWISEGLGIPNAGPSLQSNASTLIPSDITPPTPVQLAPPAGLETPMAQGSPRDIKSFVAEKAPSSDNQFAAVVAYFYRFEAPAAQRLDAIDSKVLQDAARLSGRKRLAKPRYTLKNAKTAGYLDSVGRGQFGINSVGENLVAMALPGDGRTAQRAKPARKRSAKKTSKKRGKARR
jgi:hypothetical protein